MLISRNLAVVRQLCEQVAVMYRGKVVEFGEADQVFRAPQAEYTRTLLEAVPRLESTATGPIATGAEQ